MISGNPIDITIAYDVRQTVPGFHVYFQLFDTDGLMLFETIHNGDEDSWLPFLPGHYVSRATIPADFLAGRMYDVQIGAAIAKGRACIPQPSPVRIRLNVTGFGRVNRAYPGYVAAGKIAPLIPWHTEAVKEKVAPLV